MKLRRTGVIDISNKLGIPTKRTNTAVKVAATSTENQLDIVGEDVFTEAVLPLIQAMTETYVSLGKDVVAINLMAKSIKKQNE